MRVGRPAAWLHAAVLSSFRGCRLLKAHQSKRVWMRRRLLFPVQIVCRLMQGHACVSSLAVPVCSCPFSMFVRQLASFVVTFCHASAVKRDMVLWPRSSLYYEIPLSTAVLCSARPFLCWVCLLCCLDFAMSHRCVVTHMRFSYNCLFVSGPLTRLTPRGCCNLEFFVHECSLVLWDEPGCGSCRLQGVTKWDRCNVCDAVFVAHLSLGISV